MTGKSMKKIIVTIGLLSVLGFRVAGQSAKTDNGPRFLSNSELAAPQNYREWVWLSSGLGMSYGPGAQAAAQANPPFDNVFVTPEAYRAFIQTGKWPNGTMFVLELRRSQGEGSINQAGHFQGGLIAIEAEVKDEKRFAGGWGYFQFGDPAKPGKLLSNATSDCQACHSKNGAVDSTFVQFYPTLMDVAKQKGTFRQTEAGRQ
jgi:Cytochrome P460